MLKRIRLSALALTLLATACATVPETVEPPRPAEPTDPRPVEPVREAPLRIGVVVSSTGSPVLQRYAEMVLEGARLGARQGGTAVRDVELVIRDDGGTAAGASRAVRELEAAGIRHIVGPLLDEAVVAAAAARSGEGTLLISPTAVAQPATARNVYALNVVDDRGGAALGEYARRYTRVGVLYPRTPEHTPQARAFMEAYRAGGRGTVTEAGFDPGTTNVTAQLSQLRQARVEAIFFPGTERHLQLVLPQIDYAGLGAVQMLGTETWLSEGLRHAAPRLMEGAIVATPLWQESPDIAWREFVQLYESQHRRTLDSPIPALGYDAVLLAVRAAAGTTAGEYRGATGVLAIAPGGVTRKPFLVRIQSGRLVPVH
jgi:ABC-type branched-subunit amino acid transport system substrate-binding protein